MCVKSGKLIINLVDSLPFKRFPAQQGGVVGGCHRCVGVSKFFSWSKFSNLYARVCTSSSTCVRRVSLKRGLLSHISLRLLKIIEPYLVDKNRMANAQLLGYESRHLGQNLFFNRIKKVRSLPEEPERVILKQTPPYNLCGVFPFQPFSTRNGWVTAE
jgi:hypothetical protein